MNQSDIWKVTPVEVPIEVTFLVLMCVVGTFGNILTFTATFRSKKLRTPLHLILAVAMVTDMVICGIDLPFVTYGTILGRWDLPQTLCQFVGVLLLIAAGASLVLNVVIALNRVLGCFPQSKICRNLSTQRATKMCIIIAIFYTIGLLSPIIIGYLEIDYLLPYGTCLISNNNPMDVLAVYLTVVGALGAYSCTIIIALMYIIIFVRLKLQAINVATNNKKKCYLKATRNMVILYIFYVICWTPDVLHNKIDVMLEAPVWVTRSVTIILKPVTIIINTIYIKLTDSVTKSSILLSAKYQIQRGRK